MRPSRATIELGVKIGSDEHKKLGEIFDKFVADKQGSLTVNGADFEIYACDMRVDFEYGDCLCFTFELKIVPPSRYTDLLESIYRENPYRPI